MDFPNSRPVQCIHHIVLPKFFRCYYPLKMPKIIGVVQETKKTFLDVRLRVLLTDGLKVLLVDLLRVLVVLDARDPDRLIPVRPFCILAPLYL